MKQENSASLSEMVYQYLLDMILSMEIRPGDRVPETRIAAQLGISRTPIREAMKRLANDGIINMYPNRYAEVASWDESVIREIGIMRVQLDNLAVKLAVFYGSNAEFEKMREYARACLEAGLAENIAEKIRKDCEFHLELSMISKNRQLIEVQKKLYLKIEFLQSWRGSFLENPQEQFRQHEEIVDALIERDQERALKLLIRHNLHFHDLENDHISTIWP